MRILFYEDPKQHDNNRGEALCKDLNRFLGAETKLVKTLREADSELDSNSFNVVIVHHKRVEDIAFLKRNHPDQKYAGYSGSISSPSIPKPGSITEEVIKEMREHYDILLFNLSPKYIKNVFELKGLTENGKIIP